MKFSSKDDEFVKAVKAVKAIGVASDCQEARLKPPTEYFFCAETVWQIPFLKRQKDSLVITVVGCGRLLLASRTLWGASSVRQWKHLFFPVFIWALWLPSTPLLVDEQFGDYTNCNYTIHMMLIINNNYVGKKLAHDCSLIEKQLYY